METPFGEMPVFDAHAHFFSYRFFQGLLEPVKARYAGKDPYAAMGEELKLELPEVDPAKLAARWVAEMDVKGVSRTVLMASAVGDEESAAAAVKAFPDRITGYFMLDPTRPDAAVRARHAVLQLGLRGIALFPAMHHFSAADERVWPIYHAAAERNAVVFVHFGLLKIAIRDRLGLPSKFDMRYSNPLDLHKAAKEFPNINFQIPHFGCGFFREALMLGELCDNVRLDTSSSNAWVVRSTAVTRCDGRCSGRRMSRRRRNPRNAVSAAGSIFFASTWACALSRMAERLFRILTKRGALAWYIDMFIGSP